ncbi:MAG: SDR family NAD(P)-dependent oxidoreductase [Planctomycetota bacterium]
MGLSGRVAIVTGGGRGIGRESALALARAGADVAVLARSEAQIAAVASEVRALGVRSLAVPCDVTRVEAVNGSVDRVRQELGRVDILVNNAGVARSAPFLRTEDALWDELLAVNLTAPFRFARAVLGGMLERGWGRIVTVASIAGKVGAAYIAAYTASKHGVIGLTRALAVEVAAKGVTVNAVCPGYVDTEMTTTNVHSMGEKTGRSEEEIRRILADQSPQKRIYRAEEVASLVAYLASDEAGGVNGQAINLCGGAVFS